MKLAEYSLSFPVYTYVTEISYYIPRKTTVMEWCILELAKIVSNKPEYENVSVGQMFKEIFKIDNPNQLVLPCFYNLTTGIAALELEEDIYNDTDLFGYPCKNIKITATGLEMHEKQMLSGPENIKITTVYYDYIRNKFFRYEEDKYKSSPVGLIMENYTNAAVAFPEEKAKDYFNKLILDGKFLEPSAIINKINAPDEFLDRTSYAGPFFRKNGFISWEIQKVNAYLTKNMELSFNNFSNLPKVQDFIISEIQKNTENDFYNTLPSLNINDVDKEFKTISLFNSNISEVVKKVEDFIKINTNLIVNLSYFGEKKAYIKDIISAKNSGIYFVIDNSAESYSLQIEKQNRTQAEKDKKTIIVTIPANNNVPDTVVSSKESSVVFGKSEFHLENSSITSNICLIGETRKALLDFNKIAEEYYNALKKADIPDAIYILPAFNENQFIKEIENRLTSIKTFYEKAKFINDTNRDTNKFYDKQYLDAAFVEKNVINNIEIPELNAESYIEMIHKITSTNAAIAANIELVKKLLRKMNEKVSLKSIKEVETVYKNCQQLKDSKKWFVKEGFLDALINKEIKLEYCQQYFLNEKIESSIDAPFFKTTKQLASELRKFLDSVIKAGFNLDNSLSIEQAQQKLPFLSRDIYKNVEQAVVSYNNTYNQIGNITDSCLPYLDKCLLQYDSKKKIEFNTINLMAKNLYQAVSFFRSAKNIHYNQLFVIDTNALLNNPKIIDIFRKCKMGLVIPTTVVDELDKFKDENKGQKGNLTQLAQDSRTSSKKILEAIQQKEKWIIVEKPHPELLSDGIPKNKADNLILSTALKFIEKNPVIITNDRNFSIKAYGENISTINTTEFFEKYKNAFITDKKANIKHQPEQKNKSSKKGK